MKNDLYFEIDGNTTTIVDEHDFTILSIPTDALTDYIEENCLNCTGDIEKSYFEERSDDGRGFTYTPIDVEIKQQAFAYLEENTENTILLYLKELTNELSKKRNT